MWFPLYRATALSEDDQFAIRTNKSLYIGVGNSTK